MFGLSYTRIMNIGKKFGKRKKTPETFRFRVSFGGDKRDQTANLLNAIIHGHNKMNILGIISP